MSFSVAVKDELCEVMPADRECMLVELTAMLLFSRAFERGNCVMQTENRKIADRFIDFLIDEFETILTVITAPSLKRNGTHLYTLTVDNPQDLDRIKEHFFQNGMPKMVTPEQLKDENALASFVRGAYVSCGSMNDPHKEYHLEFVVQNHDLAANLASILSSVNIPIKLTQRKNNFILYLKESENIEDLLTLMGATNSTLELMNIKVMKDMRNKVNRVTNCETANIGKTVAASAKQVEDIKLIIQKKGIEYLPDNLKEVAQIRLENPELSLNELVQAMGNQISKSGINHRLKRIGEIADKLRS
ncbi:MULTISPECIES: DNA-binding protein WhiA [Clostridiaceae]|uniref:Probable cell division protein WhiA n=1 Tax=Clostridium facile TaxID=2763035 RepID=A0ABR7INZ7_9CLOT|nr:MULTISPECIES: DNA-binding protein WhiA [Clostridiaceae]MBC5786794.1 DNA-binding protein WhiA [Clostridium facile]PWM99767.1 MAG: DNA-binding protein WhiA [Massilioclostridium sp.]